MAASPPANPDMPNPSLTRYAAELDSLREQGLFKAERVITGPQSAEIELADGRKVTVPLAWFPRLLHANADQRRNWRLNGDGQGIHWPDIDEDLSVAGLLRGAAAPEASRRTV